MLLSVEMTKREALKPLIPFPLRCRNDKGMERRDRQRDKKKEKKAIEVTRHRSLGGQIIMGRREIKCYLCEIKRQRDRDMVESIRL